MFEIGNSLREARLRQRLDFRQVEQATKIRTRYLRALEEEDFEALPAETYVRGFLRTYAESLGLDGRLFVDEYNSRFVPGAERQSPLRPRRSRPPRRRAEHRIETNVILVALTAIGVMTALVIAAWKFSSDSKEATPPLRTDIVTSVRPKARPKPAVKPAEKANLLVTAARGNCWLEVRSIRTGPNGKRVEKLLYEGTLEKGQRQRFVAAKLWINASVPENLAVSLNGDSLRIGGGEPVVVEITANSVTPV